jgi:hypothetical protein
MYTIGIFEFYSRMVQTILFYYECTHYLIGKYNDVVSYPVDFQRTEHASYISKTADHEDLLMGHSTCFVYEYIERFIQLNAWNAPETRSWPDSILCLGM